MVYAEYVDGVGIHAYNFLRFTIYSEYVLRICNTFTRDIPQEYCKDAFFGF